MQEARDSYRLFTRHPLRNVLDSASETLPLLAYLILACALMLTDHRLDIGVKVRAQLSVFIEPVWWLASLPSRMWSGVDDELATRQALQESNEKLVRELQIVNARMQRMRAINDENQRLRDLLNASRSGSMQVQMVSILDVDLNPYRQRIVLNAGANQGVKVGQAIMDAGGILGQVIEVSNNKATALLVTDADHAIPVQVARSGFAIASVRANRIGGSLDIPQSPNSQRRLLLHLNGLAFSLPASCCHDRKLIPRNRLFMVGEPTAARLTEAGSVSVNNHSNPPRYLHRGRNTQPLIQLQRTRPRQTM